MKDPLIDLVMYRGVKIDGIQEDEEHIIIASTSSNLSDDQDDD